MNNEQVKSVLKKTSKADRRLVVTKEDVPSKGADSTKYFKTFVLFI